MLVINLKREKSNFFPGRDKPKKNIVMKASFKIKEERFYN